jgi:hypothetical protein
MKYSRDSQNPDRKWEKINTTPENSAKTGGNHTTEHLKYLFQSDEQSSTITNIHSQEFRVMKNHRTNG